MSSSSCTRRSLITFDALRPSQCRRTSPRLPLIATAPFTSSSALFALPPKKSLVSKTGPPKKGGSTLKLKKKGAPERTGRKPAVGERKALRKRIVLSNNNALEVPGMREMDQDLLNDESARGMMLALPEAVVDSLRAIEAFKVTQGWHLFRRPATLVRKETLQLAQLLGDSKIAQGKETRRILLAGERACGKSTLALQTMAAAFIKGWIVINLPDAKDLTIGHTEYQPVPGTSPLQYSQPVYVANLLQQIVKANHSVLSKLQLSLSHDLPVPVQSNISLDRLAEMGVQNPEQSWQFFNALWAELTAPGRPPILYSLDALAHIMKNSRYLARDGKPIHSHQLALVAHYLSYLSDAKALPNGGLILAAASESNKPNVPAMDHAITQQLARQAGEVDVPKWNPYVKIDERVYSSMQNMEVMDIKGITKEDARGILEYYAHSGVMRKEVNEKLVSERWTLAGSGIIGELEKSAVRMRL